MTKRQNIKKIKTLQSERNIEMGGEQQLDPVISNHHHEQVSKFCIGFIIFLGVFSVMTLIITTILAAVGVI